MAEPTRTVDILVLGATVAGLTAAVEAAAAGASVEVLDPSEVTRFGTGLVTVAQGEALRDIELHRGVEACDAMVAETLRAIAWLTETLPLHGVQPTPRTAYSLAVDGHVAFHLRHEARLLRRGGVVVDVTDDQPLAPLETRPALVVADQAQVEPSAHRQALLDAATAAGVEVRRGVRLGRFTPGQPWKVTYGPDDTEIATTHVIDTIGSAPWGGRLGGSLRVCAVAETDTPAGFSHDIHLLVDTPAALVVQRRRTLLVGHPVAPQDEHAALVDLVAFASGRLGLDVTGVRTRPVEVTADRLPVVGRLPLLDGAWIARGFGLAETTVGTAAGLQLAAATTGGDVDLPWAPLRPPTGALALYRRWAGSLPDPMVDVPALLKRRGMDD